MSVRSRRVVLPLLAALTLASPAAGALRAQDAVAEPSRVAAPAGPTADAARAGVGTAPVHAAAAAREGGREEERAPRNRPGFGQPEALMIVGGTAVVLGILVGGSGGGVLAFGGAVVGLVGLYQYLR